MPFPTHWKKIKLKDLVNDPKQDIVDGPFGSNLKASEYVDSGIPIIRLQNIERNSFIDKNIKYITSDKAQELERHNFKTGDIVISKLGKPLGKACLIPENFTNGIVVADVVRVRVNENIINKDFLAYAINSQKVIEQLEPLIKGTTRPRVNLTHLRNIEIPFAPKEEQNLIVEKIEELFSQLDAGVAGLKRAQTALKRYRASVLKAAFEGRLVPQDPNGEPVKILLRKESINQICENSDFKIPAKWALVKIKDVGEIVTGNTPSKKDKSNYGSYMPFVKPPELMGGLITKANDSISQKGSKSARVAPENSVLVSCIGKIGKTGINKEPVAFNQQINAVIFNKLIHPIFGLYYIQ